MSDIAIRVENLGKRYTIGVGQRHDTLRDALADFRLRVADFGRKSPKSRIENPKSEEFWALKDVSFEVHRGEVVGVIGRNGAGKSTLLKILSRITEPTTGYAEIHGRVGSLLEVGTGFHPELTGRENIYLNGAILGMKRTEIDRKFDEIVAFSEIEKFLDTPVKRYSSGMYVRLAFAVAAHLEPEILLVDEVLAVGDAAFQKKCLGKMGDIAGEGRTVLFVSHNMAIMQVLCQNGILLDKGNCVTNDVMSAVVARYLDRISTYSMEKLVNRTDRTGKGRVQITDIRVTRGDDVETSALVTGDNIRFVIEVSTPVPGMSTWLKLYNRFGQQIATFNSIVQGSDDTTSMNSGFVLQIPELLLTAGQYYMNCALLVNGELHDYIERAVVFEVHEGQIRGRPVLASTEVNVFFPHQWVLPVF